MLALYDYILDVGIAVHHIDCGFVFLRNVIYRNDIIEGSLWELCVCVKPDAFE